MRPPRVRTHSFPPSIRRIYTSGPCSCRASSCLADLATFVCLMRFLFVGSVVCRRLPSAHASRRRPCLWLCAWRYLLHSGLAPIRTRSCRAHKKNPLSEDSEPIGDSDASCKISLTSSFVYCRRLIFFPLHGSSCISMHIKVGATELVQDRTSSE